MLKLHCVIWAELNSHYWRMRRSSGFFSVRVVKVRTFNRILLKFDINFINIIIFFIQNINQCIFFFLFLLFLEMGVSFSSTYSIGLISGTSLFSNISCLGTRRQGGIGKSNLNSGRVGLFSKRHGGIGKSSLNWIFSPWFSLTCGNIFFMVVNIWSHFSHFMQVIPEVQSSRAALWCRNEVSFPVAKSHLLQE